MCQEIIACTKCGEENKIPTLSPYCGPCFIAYEGYERQDAIERRAMPRAA